MFAKLTTFFSKPKVQYKLSNFREVKVLEKDPWNRVDNGHVKFTYYDKNNKVVVTGGCRLKTGQLTSIFVEPKYRGKVTASDQSLGEELLTKIIIEATKFNIVNKELKSVWAVRFGQHKFWQNVYNNSFKFQERVHESVTGSGYVMEISKSDFKY